MGGHQKRGASSRKIGEGDSGGKGQCRPVNGGKGSGGQEAVGWQRGLMAFLLPERVYILPPFVHAMIICVVPSGCQLPSDRSIVHR